MHASIAGYLVTFTSIDGGAWGRIDREEERRTRYPGMLVGMQSDCGNIGKWRADGREACTTVPLRKKRTIPPDENSSPCHFVDLDSGIRGVDQVNTP